MGRLLSDWLTGYLEYTTKISESPISYHTWAGVSLLSASLQRRVSMKWGHTKIYPNQYIVLIGPSGMGRKGEPLVLAKTFMENLGLPIASQSITREALIKLMANSTSQFMNKGTMVIQAPINIVANELTVFMGQKNIKLLGDLTDMYDSQAKWTYETKHGDNPKDSITGVCVNMLASTAPDWIPSILPPEAVGGGWTSRVIFVVESKKSKVIADPDIFPVDTKLEDQLRRDLQQIHKLVGEFKFTQEARQLYVEWYEDQEAKFEQGVLPVTDTKFLGYISRRATHIKKLGMCLSASRGSDLLINDEDFNRALKLLEVTEKKMSRAFRGIGRSDLADITDKVLTFIAMKGKVTRSQTLRALYGDLDMWTLEQVERILDHMKVIKIRILNDESDMVYEYIGDQISAN